MMFVTSNRAGRAPMGDATNRATTAAIAVGAAAALSLSYLAHGWYRSRRSPRVLVLVSGTLQDGFPLRRNLDAPGAPAEFVGWALVRGVKMYLDPKPRGCREWVDPDIGERQRVNPALVCTGDPKDANVYACYAVAEAACLRALLGEPRMLGMTPDTALVDLGAEETSRGLASFLAGEARRWWSSTRPTSSSSPHREGASGGAKVAEGHGRSLDEGRVAMLTVVAHGVPHGAVPVEPAYVKDDGTRVTSFAPCLKRFGGGFELGTSAHELGLEEAIRKWQRRMEPGDGDASSLYGAAPETFRMNYAVTAGEVARAFSSRDDSPS